MQIAKNSWSKSNASRAHTKLLLCLWMCMCVSECVCESDVYVCACECELVVTPTCMYCWRTRTLWSVFLQENLINTHSRPGPGPGPSRVHVTYTQRWTNEVLCIIRFSGAWGNFSQGGDSTQGRLYTNTRVCVCEWVFEWVYMRACVNAFNLCRTHKQTKGHLTCRTEFSRKLSTHTHTSTHASSLWVVWANLGTVCGSANCACILSFYLKAPTCPAGKDT